MSIFKILGGPIGQIASLHPALQGIKAVGILVKAAAIVDAAQQITGISDPVKALRVFFTDPKYADQAMQVEQATGKKRDAILNTIEWAQKNNIPLSKELVDIEKLRMNELANRNRT